MTRETAVTRGARVREPAHPTPLTYLKVASTLAVVTVVEVAIFYVHFLRPVLVPMFIVLSAVKFALVAMFYMHLRFDRRMFSGLFVGGLLLAAFMTLALIAMFRTLFMGP